VAVQKFTRPITRELTVGGERLAFTFTEQGISLRPVGARKPPSEASWATVVCGVVGRPPAAGSEPTADELAAALQLVRAGGSGSPTPPPSPPRGESVPRAAAVTAQPPAGTSNTEYTGLLARLDRWLAMHRPRFLHALQPGASAAELDRLQHEISAPLPPGLRTLLAWHNGQNEDIVGSFEQSWRLMSTQAIADAKKELDNDATGQAAKDGWQRGWIPFLEDDGGDYLCLDTSQPTAPVRGFWPGKKADTIVAPSLAAWLEDFVTELEQGHYTEDPERGDFIRRGRTAGSTPPPV
jgi:cell wall assembly regulator SMI1